MPQAQQQKITTHSASEVPNKVDIPIGSEKALDSSITAVMPNTQRHTSGLSLKSIQRKKDHQIKQMDVALSQEEMPKDLFTQQQLSVVWERYVENLETKGRYNMAAILKIDSPKLS